MRKFIKSTIASLLVIILLISSSLPIFAVGAPRAAQPTQYSKQYNSGNRDVVCTTLDGTSALAYYGSTYSYDTLSAMSSGALLLELRELMSTTHTTYTSYNDCHYKANQSDCEGGDATVVSYIYSAYSATMDDWAGSGNVGWKTIFFLLDLAQCFCWELHFKRVRYGCCNGNLSWGIRL